MEATTNTLTTTVNNNVKSVAEKVNMIVGLVKTEMLTNRNVIATLYDNRDNEALKDIAGVLFTDAASASRKVAINAAVKRYVKLFPFAIVVRFNENSIDYRCARLEKVTDGVFVAKEMNAIATLEAVLYNYYNGGGQIAVETGMYYNDLGEVIDSAVAAESIKAAKEAAKEARAEKTEKRNTKIIADTDFYTLIAAAINKAPDDNTKAILEAILKK